MKVGVLLPVLAGAALIGFAGVASASPAVVNSSVNLRSGPGVSYPVAGKVKAGQRVDVVGCRASWCYITKAGPDGWVAARYLGRVQKGPVVNFHLNFGNPPSPPAKHPGPAPTPAPNPQPKH